jgi:hypothetical protein
MPSARRGKKPVVTVPPARAPHAAATRRARPLILVRGFGGLSVDDEKRVAYQGFNDGTVYPQKRGENYIYEGLVLRFMKSRWGFQDATNVVGYYPDDLQEPLALPAELGWLPRELFHGQHVVVDPAMALSVVRSMTDPCRTLWVFRYYDLNDRNFARYGEALARLITFVRWLAYRPARDRVPAAPPSLADLPPDAPGVNIIAHSMGGLIVREVLQRTYPLRGQSGADHINKIVTLGTPHRGISFQVLRDWIRIDAEEELEHFNPSFQANPGEPTSAVNLDRFFPPERILTVVGTNYRTYGPNVASWMNRLASVAGEFGPNYNRSDGLVKQTAAQLDGAPRTFVHKCHGGPDSLVTSREAFEVATRFLFGDVKVWLHLVAADVRRGLDWIGRSEVFFGVSIKPRGVDFDLFHQSTDAENCYGPFRKPDLSDGASGKQGDEPPAFGWAGPDRLIWEGWLDTSARVSPAAPDSSAAGGEPPSPAGRFLRSVESGGRAADVNDIVMRLDVYVGERDLFGIGFSDNVIFRKQYYVRARISDTPPARLERFELYDGEAFAEDRPGVPMREDGDGWLFDVAGTGFTGTLKVRFAVVPEDGDLPASVASRSRTGPGA